MKVKPSMKVMLAALALSAGLSGCAQFDEQLSKPYIANGVTIINTPSVKDHGPGVYPTPPNPAPNTMQERVFVPLNNMSVWQLVLDEDHRVPARAGQVSDSPGGIVVQDGVRLAVVVAVGMRAFPGQSILPDVDSTCLVPVGKNFVEIGTYNDGMRNYTAVEYVGDYTDPAKLVLDDEPKAVGWCTVGAALAADRINIKLPGGDG